MSQTQNTPINHNLPQTLLELIYSLKGLAQTVEMYHNNLSRLLEDDIASRQRDIRDIRSEMEKVRDFYNKGQHSLTNLPVTISDRIEKLIERVERGVDRRIEDAIDEVHEAVKDTQRHLQSLNQTLPQKDQDDKDDTGSRLEVSEDGHVRVNLHKTTLKKISLALIVIIASGFGYGTFEMIKTIIGS